MRSSLAFGGLLVLASATPAFGHANLLEPLPRDDIAHKTGPCGPTTRSATPAIFAPGETITVRWEETIEHPGWYRIAFAPAGEVGFDDNILVDDIPDIQGGTLPRLYEQVVTLPAEPCDDCTLQLIQYMSEVDPPTLYFSCADLQLVGAAAPDAGPGAPDAAPGAPDAATGPVADAGNAVDGVGDPPGLCSAASLSRSNPWLPLWLLISAVAISFVLRRRRG